jgi:hypothetical protein
MKYWFVCAFFVFQVGFAQSMVVRVIGGNDGKPLVQQTVSVQFFYEKLGKISSAISFRTNKAGEIRFEFPEPLPEQMGIDIELESNSWHCRCSAMVETNAVLTKGTVEAPASTLQHPLIPPPERPGQIVFVASPFTSFEKWLTRRPGE